MNAVDRKRLVKEFEEFIDALVSDVVSKSSNQDAAWQVVTAKLDVRCSYRFCSHNECQKLVVSTSQHKSGHHTKHARQSLRKQADSTNTIQTQTTSTKMMNRLNIIKRYANYAITSQWKPNWKHKSLQQLIQSFWLDRRPQTWIWTHHQQTDATTPNQQILNHHREHQGTQCPMEHWTTNLKIFIEGGQKNTMGPALVVGEYK